MLLLIRVLSRAVVRPLLRLAQASRSIAEGDFSSPDLPVKSSDEVGRLTGTFNQMKHAMAQQLTTQQDVYKRQLLGCAQTPCVLHPMDAGCAFLQNAFLI